jgi:hypothetical protein
LRPLSGRLSEQRRRIVAAVTPEEIAAAVLLREPVNGIRIVGVDGKSGSGEEDRFFAADGTAGRADAVVDTTAPPARPRRPVS